MTYYFVLIFFLYGLGRFIFLDLKSFFIYLIKFRRRKNESLRNID